MNSELMNIGGAMEEPIKPMMACRSTTPREKLLSKKADYEARLARVNEAIKFLDDNPSFDRGFMLLSQAM